MERKKLAQYIALGATIAIVIGYIIGFYFNSIGNDLMADVGAVLILVGVGAGIISYILSGFGIVTKMAWKTAKWGLKIPVFPLDIIVFFITFGGTLYYFFFLPIIPVRMAYKDSLKKQNMNF